MNGWFIAIHSGKKMSFDKRQYNAAYEKAHPEKWAIYRRRYREKNHDKQLNRVRSWRYANREKALAATKRWQAKNATLIREQYIETRKAVLDFLGRVCIRCGFSDERALQINHKSGCGRKNRQNTRSLYRSILNGQRHDIELLCANCNAIHAKENNLVPWKFSK